MDKKVLIGTVRLVLALWLGLTFMLLKCAFLRELFPRKAHFRETFWGEGFSRGMDYLLPLL